MPWLTRAFFLLVAAIAMAGIVSGAACTRRGKSSPIPPTSSPLTTIDVNPRTGSDTTGDGSSAKPYKTLTKAIAVVKSSPLQGLAIQLSLGVYNAANGEKFPIIIPTGMTINGSGYGAGFARGSFINGNGPDLAYESLAGVPSGSAFATLEVASGVASVSLNDVYVGSASLPVSGSYAALDALGALGVSRATFAVDTPVATHPKVAGVLVPSGGLNCTGCVILGGDFALLAFTLPNASAPAVVLSGQPTLGMIGGKIGIGTDGSASINASFQTFQSKQYGYQDGVAPIASPSGSFTLGTVDLGSGPSGSQGGNLLEGAGISEISVTLPLAQVFAYGNYWNANTQGTDSHGLYPRRPPFSRGAHGRNVTVAGNADGAAVFVGPPPTPTPQPSTSPSPSPTSSPT
jgi:hypothetical protein